MSRQKEWRCKHTMIFYIVLAAIVIIVLRVLKASIKFMVFAGILVAAIYIILGTGVIKI
jgi:hypothetical protein